MEILSEAVGEVVNYVIAKRFDSGTKSAPHQLMGLSNEEVLVTGGNCTHFAFQALDVKLSGSLGLCIAPL